MKTLDRNQKTKYNNTKEEIQRKNFFGLIAEKKLK
jgi:hypothetical protein